MPEVRVVDSITQLGPQDAGCIAVSGSHGGASAARYAVKARPLFCFFNDAGVGKDSAGLAGLDLLQENGLAGCTVAHTSARIGEARSTLETGEISHLNAAAKTLGIHVGQTCRSAIAHLQST
jgi:hypothetical protein